MTMKTPGPSVSLAVAERVARQFASLLQVEAVALAGSRTSDFADESSDVDLYVYVSKDIPLEARKKIAAGAESVEIGNTTWEPGDEWIDGETRVLLDVMYRHVRWIEEQLDHVLLRHRASVGYSTCFWYNVLHSQPLFDRSGSFAKLQKRADQPYPPELRRAIIAKNYSLLRRNQSSYLHQIELAVRRNDPVSVNHRVAAMLASYFDVLFAVNQLPHPGEKRLLEHATKQCAKCPAKMERQVTKLVASLSGPADRTVKTANALIDGMDELLTRERLVSRE
jgi:Domain of unknown function (DUF4037)